MGSTGTGAPSAEGDVQRAAERVSLACRALSTAAGDLRVAYMRSGMLAVEDAADQLRAETERVCELAEELAKLGKDLMMRAPAPLGRPG